MRQLEEAAKTMGVISIDDQQTLAHKDENGNWVLNDLPPVLNEQKSPAEWTLQEVKDYCEQTNCLNCCFNPTNKWRGCTFLEQKYKASGHIVTNKPARWNLKPHWTEQDIEDAKAVQRIFPQIKYIEKNYNILDQIIKQDTLILGETASFPSIKNRQTIAIAEILADGQNSVDGHNEED